MPPLNEVNAEITPQIHFIWFGGPIPGPGATHDYRASIQAVALALAGSHTVNVWLSPEFSLAPNVYHENLLWCGQMQNVHARNVSDPDTLNLNAVELEALQMQWDILPRNYGAMSDIARVAILDVFGGMYIDTDCSIEQAPDPTPIVATYGFMATKRSWESNSFLNGIMATEPGGQVIQAYRQAITNQYAAIIPLDYEGRLGRIRSLHLLDNDDGFFDNEIRAAIMESTLNLAGPGRLNAVASEFMIDDVNLFSQIVPDNWDDEEIEECVIPYLEMPQIPDDIDHDAFGRIHLEFHNTWLPPQQNAAQVAPEDNDGEADGAEVINGADPLDAALDAATNVAGLDAAE